MNWMQANRNINRNKIRKKNPIRRLICFLEAKHIFDRLPDEVFLRLMYWGRTGRFLSLKKPLRFNEKLQWLKLFDHKQVYHTMADKAGLTGFLRARNCEAYAIPTLGSWRNPDEINPDQLPDRFVLKTTHDSGTVVLCENKSEFDWKQAKEILGDSLRRRYDLHGREWVYRGLTPAILAQPFLGKQKEDLCDYKFFCFHGLPKLILVCSGRFSTDGLREDFYDLSWKKLPLRRASHPDCAELLDKPDELERMIELAKQVSAEIPFLRVDFMLAEGKIYIGELTFYPSNGFEGFEPDCWDRKLGEWLKLPEDSGSA